MEIVTYSTPSFIFRFALCEINIDNVEHCTGGIENYGIMTRKDKTRKKRQYILIGNKNACLHFPIHSKTANITI